MMVRVGGHGCGAGGAPGAVRGGGVSKSVAKAPRAGIGGERKRGISTFLFRRFGAIGAFATDLDNRRRRGPLRGRRPRRSPRHSGRPPTPGRLFSGRLRAFPGNDIMMAHSHEVQFVVEQAREDRHEHPDPGPARWAPGAGLRPLSGVHARRGRPRLLRTARGNRPLQVDRRQGLYRKGNDHAP